MGETTERWLMVIMFLFHYFSVFFYYPASEVSGTCCLGVDDKEIACELLLDC